tara:strand:- start:1486 stop:1650 length:165 start_codon:yes stop_codon:yes gene_type:complete
MNKTILAMILGATNASGWWAYAMFGDHGGIFFALVVTTPTLLLWVIEECIDLLD